MYYSNRSKEMLSDKSKEIQKIKIYVVNKLRKLEKEQKSFLESVAEEKKLDDFLTVNQIMQEYSASRKTIYRWRNKGLKVYQKKPSSNLRVKRADLVKFLNETNYGR